MIKAPKVSVGSTSETPQVSLTSLNAWIHTRWRAAAFVGFFGFCVQLVYIFESRSDPSFDVPVVDAEVYHEAAARLAATGSLTDGAFWQPPFFPFLLGGVYTVFGPSMFAAKLFFAFVGAMSCTLVWAIGRRLFTPEVGFVAGCILVVYGPFVFFNTQLLPAGLAAFLDLLAIYLLLNAYQKPQWLRWLFFGVCAGLAIITVPNAIVILIIGIGLLVSRTIQRRRWRIQLAHGVFAILGSAAAICPVTVHNYVATGEFIPISVNGGINFFIGNNPDFDQTVAVRPGPKWERLTRLALADRQRTQAQQDRYFYGRGFHYLLEDPAGFVGGLVHKTGQFLNSREVPRNVDVYVHRSYSHLLSALTWRVGPFAFPFGLLFPLAAVGLLAIWGPSRLVDGSRAAHLALLAFVVTYAVTVVLFFVTARYRLPVIPAMCLFAAAGVRWIWREAVARPKRPLAIRFWLAGVVFLMAGLVSSLPIKGPTDNVDFRAELYMNVGRGHIKAVRLDEAEHHLRHAIELNPTYSQAYCKLAQVAFWRGQPAQSRTLLQQAIDLDPDDSEPYWLLGTLQAQEGRTSDAVATFQRALAIDPLAPRVHVSLADALMALDRPDEAIRHYRTADRTDAQPGGVLIRFADALVSRQQYAEALESYDRALTGTDPNPPGLDRIARLLVTCPQLELRDCTRAIGLAEAASRLTAHQHPYYLDTLALSYADCAYFEDAIRVTERAIEVAQAADDPALTESLRHRLALYRQRLIEQEGK